MTAKLGNKLGKLRSERKLSAEDVADKLGVHGILLKKWERAKEWPDNEMLIKLAQIYEVPPEELTSIVEMETAYSNSAWGLFPYPTVIFVVFLVIGYFTGYWHPAWVILLTVPLYRRVGEYMISRRKADDSDSVN